MAQLEDVIEPLFTICGGAPDELLINAYRAAARKFLTDTYAWREEVDVTVDGGSTAFYDATVPTDAEMFDFTQMDDNGTRLTKMTYEQAAYRQYPTTGTASALRMGALNQLVVMPDPGTDISATLTIRAVLRPTLTADTIPDDIVNRFSEAIEFGVAQRVFRVPNEDWTDYQASTYYGELFQEQIDLNTVRASDGMMRGVKRTVRYGGL